MPLEASSTSGLKVNFEVTGPVTLNDSILVFRNAGKVTVTAKQEGNINYNTATPVTNQFCINPPKPSIESSGSGSSEIILESSDTLGIKNWFLDGNLIPENSSQLTIEEAGSYTLLLNSEGCMSEISDPVNIVITDLGYTDNSDKIKIFPVPVMRFLSVQIPEQVNEVRHLYIVNVNGKKIDISSGVEKHGLFINIILPPVSSGYYILLIETKKTIYREGFIKI